MDNSPFSPFRPSRPNWMHTLSSPPSAFVPVLDPPSSPWTHNPATMTPNSTCSTSEPLSSPEPRQSRLHPGLQSSGKRGRPRADLITHLMMEGSSSPSEIKCRVCNRVFPREKSLQAHLRTHTGERPYSCDFPGCSRAFTQSGQLKTHQRLHAGEKPFMCSSPGCTNRYTHANRTCPLHPYHKPQRTSDLVLASATASVEAAIDPSALASPEVARWLENYRRGKQERAGPATPTTTASCLMDTPIRSKRALLSQELEQENVGPMVVTPVVAAGADAAGKSNDENNTQSMVIKSPLRTALRTPLKMSPLRMTPLRSPLTLSPRTSRIRMVMSDITPTSSDGNVLKPKRRWLKEVFQEQEHHPEPQQQQQHAPYTPPQVQLPQLPQRQLFSSSSAFKAPRLAPADPEDLARPITWDTDEQQQPAITMSKSWLVAATALVELGGKVDGVQSQPLNLSIARDH